MSDLPLYPNSYPRYTMTPKYETAEHAEDAAEMAWADRTIDDDVMEKQAADDWAALIRHYEQDWRL